MPLGWFVVAVGVAIVLAAATVAAVWGWLRTRTELRETEEQWRMSRQGYDTATQRERQAAAALAPVTKERDALRSERETLRARIRALQGALDQREQGRVRRRPSGDD